MIDLKVSEDDEDVGYVFLPEHPRSGVGVVKKTIELRQLVPDLKGPDVNLDFDADGVLIGIEIIG